MQGIDGVNRVLQSFRDKGINQDVLDGYYGTLIENFETDKQFRTAVEVTAGNRYVIIFLILQGHVKISFGRKSFF